MVEPQVSRFWQAAIRSGLLDEVTLLALWNAIPPEKRTHDAIDRRLARQVVNAGKLTLWQAQQLLAGRWQGLRIDRYEIQGVIGHGGMGRVYLARDVKLGRKVALKILSRERMNNPRALTRFRREAKVGAQLQHENLVRIYDEGEAHGVRYLVMEYIEGKTIGKLISEVGKLPPATAANLGRQIALGLEHLHQKGLLHRDVNPMNVLLDRDGTAKLTDLGLAIDLGDMEDIVTRDGATVGTFDYISPEQARHSRSVDGRADLYSLGCTIYHMIAGRVPFPTANLPEKLFAHQGSEPDPLVDVAPGVPEGLAAVVAKLMRKTPDERYARAIDTARALEPFAIGAVAAGAIMAAVDPLPATPGDAPSGATSDGSDPDLELKPETTTTTPSSTPTTTANATSTVQTAADFLPKIDFGPQPSLSGERGARAVKPKPAKLVAEPKPKRPLPPIPIRAVLIGAAALAAIGIVVVVSLNWKTFAKLVPKRQVAVDVTPATTDPDVVTPKSNAPHAEIAIRRGSGPEEAETSFRDAFARVSGGAGGEIVLRSTNPIRAGDPDKSLRLAGGHLIIRAAAGASPDLRVVLGGKAPWIVVAPQARLTLVGLTIRVTPLVAPNAKPDPNANPPVLIAAEGNITLERCTLAIEGYDHSARAIDAKGLEARATGCMFEGFDRPIVLGMYPGSDARFTNCLFVRDVTTDPLAGWAITATRLNTQNPGPRKLAIERCTALGAGLLAADGFAPDAPLSITATGNALRTTALVLTGIPGENLAKAILWTGKDNAYALDGAAWVVTPKGFNELKGGPTDLKSWVELMPGDKGGRDQPMKFAGGSTTEGHNPGDYAVIREKDSPPAGADPERVGPGAKP